MLLILFLPGFLFQAGCEDVKKIIGLLSKLRSEMQTNKPLLVIEDHGDDVLHWNDYLKQDRSVPGAGPLILQPMTSLS